MHSSTIQELMNNMINMMFGLRALADQARNNMIAPASHSLKNENPDSMDFEFSLTQLEEGIVAEQALLNLYKQVLDVFEKIVIWPGTMIFNS